MQPSAPEARGYTLPATVLCMSKYPESCLQIKACTSQASSCFSNALLSTAPGPGDREGRHCAQKPSPAGASQLPASASKHWPQRSARGCSGCWITKRSCHPLCLQDREPHPVLGLTNLSEQAQQNAASMLRPPKLAAKPPLPTNTLQGNRAGCALCLLQLCRPAFAGSSAMAAPSCVNLFPPLS